LTEKLRFLHQGYLSFPLPYFTSLTLRNISKDLDTNLQEHGITVESPFQVKHNHSSKRLGSGRRGVVTLGKEVSIAKQEASWDRPKLQY
jgi:hypothetical protein